MKSIARSKPPRFNALKLILLLAISVGVCYGLYRAVVGQPLVEPSQLIEFKVPTINGPTKHDLVFSGVPKAVVKVWAHPHNNDVNFDFWAAVGTYDANAEPNAGGWGANYYQALHVLLAPPGSVYLCVGGWIGATSLYAATLPSQPTVWSFEPDPAAFAELDANFKLNPELLPRVHLSNLCIDPQSGTQVLHGVADSESKLAAVRGGFTHSSQKPHSSLPAHTVTCVTMEEAAHLFNIDSDPTKSMTIHIDTEGSEYRLLPSLIGFIRNRFRRPNLMVEMHGDPPSILAANQVISILESYPNLYVDRIAPDARTEHISTLCKNCIYYAIADTVL